MKGDYKDKRLEEILKHIKKKIMILFVYRKYSKIILQIE